MPYYIILFNEYKLNTKNSYEKSLMSFDQLPIDILKYRFCFYTNIILIIFSIIKTWLYNYLKVIIINISLYF